MPALQVSLDAFVVWADNAPRVGLATRPFEQYQVSPQILNILGAFSTPCEVEEGLLRSGLPHGALVDAMDIITRLRELGILLAPAESQPPPMGSSIIVDRTADVVRAVSTYPDIEWIEPEFLHLFDNVSQYTLTSVPLAFALFSSMRYIIDADVPGDIAECGVWRGGSALIVAECLRKWADDERDLWLYDTFNWSWDRPGPEDGFLSANEHGLPDRSPRDELARLGTSQDEIVRRLEQWGLARDRIHAVSGRVQDTIPQRVPDRLCLLRLDTDLYDSTAWELEHLFPRLSRGGVLIVDDYGRLAGATKAVDDYFDHAGVDMLLTRVGTQGRVGVKT